MFLMDTEAAALLRPLDMLAMMVGGLCHDADHPGTNNDFEVKARSEKVSGSDHSLRSCCTW